MDASTEGVCSIKFSSSIDKTKYHSVKTVMSSEETHLGELEEYYDVNKCVECIRNNDFEKVALQFPDSLLCDASKVAEVIEDEANCKTFILADTSYGSCCVDEIAAEHVKADLIIHFGPACLSLTERIPVLFIFGKDRINTDDCCQSFKSCILDLDCRILIIYETVYDHAIDEIYLRLASEYKNIIRSFVKCPDPQEFLAKRNNMHMAENVERFYKPDDAGGFAPGRKDICGCTSVDNDTSGCKGVDEDTSGCIRAAENGGFIVVGKDTGGYNEADEANSRSCMQLPNNGIACIGEDEDTSGYTGVEKDTCGYRGVNEDTTRSCTRTPRDCGKCTQCDCEKCVLSNTKLRELSITTTHVEGIKCCRFGRTFNVAKDSTVDDYVVFYIGRESLTLTNHMMTYNKCQFYSYNPETNVSRMETLNVNRMLMKRYYLIEKAKDAGVVGILIGTLGIANYLSAITRIKDILRQAGKKYYTFVVGKLNAEKLANFMEIDVFVLVACPENSLINSQDFYKPIVTPFEIEIACTRARQWTGEYVTDFQELLPGAAHHVDIDIAHSEEDQIPDISLISGQLRYVDSSSQQDKEDMESSSLVRRNQNTVLSTQLHADAAEFLAKRSWKGLEPAKGETAVSKAIEGRKGIAMGYTHELNVDSGH